MQKRLRLKELVMSTLENGGCPEEGICERAETSERIKFISSLKAKRTILIGIWRFGII